MRDGAQLEAMTSRGGEGGAEASKAHCGRPRRARSGGRLLSADSSRAAHGLLQPSPRRLLEEPRAMISAASSEGSRSRRRRDACGHVQLSERGAPKNCPFYKNCFRFHLSGKYFTFSVPVFLRLIISLSTMPSRSVHAVHTAGSRASLRPSSVPVSMPHRLYPRVHP